jgi:photosystem II stability/assembly factor-like uncharacterized protein
LSLAAGHDRWTLQPSPTHQDLYGLAVDSSGGWIVGAFTLLRASAGDSWVDNSSGTFPLATLEEVLFLDENNGWAVGYAGTVLHTADGGQSWEYRSLRKDSWLYDICFVNADTGWLVGNVGLYPYDGLIVGTVDGGLSWQSRPRLEGVTLDAITFADSLYGWIVGSAVHETHQGIIYHTDDGGEHWRVQDSALYRLHDIEYLWPNRGWAVGENRLLLRTVGTLYGGLHWSGEGLDTTGVIDHEIALWAVSFISDDLGWVAGEGGTVYRTDDGGVTWTALPTGTGRDLADVVFIDGRTGWAVGGDGLILYTFNGGSYWTIQGGRTTRNLTSLSFINALTGWVVGENGTVLKTDLGGRWYSP